MMSDFFVNRSRGVGVSGVVFFLIAWFLLAFSSFAFAENQAANAQEKAIGKKPKPIHKTVLHLRSDDVSDNFLTGLHLLLANRLIGAKNADIVEQQEALAIAEKNKILKNNNRIRIADLPLLCLQTDTASVILGEVIRDETSIKLIMRSFDGISKKNLGSAEIEKPLWDMANFINEARAKLGQTLSITLEGESHRLPSRSFSPKSPEALGSAWNEMNRANAQNTLLDMLKARDGGASATDTMNAFLLTQKADGVAKLPPLAKAFAYDLGGEVEKAASLYRSKGGKTAALRLGAMYLHFGKKSAFEAYLKSAEKTLGNHPDFQAIAAQMHETMGDEKAALAAWKKAVEKKDAPFANLALAEAAEKAGETSVAAAAYRDAAGQLKKAQREALAAKAAAKALALGKAPDWRAFSVVGLTKKEAADSLKALEKIKPALKKPDALLLSAKLHWKAEELEKAQEALMQALKADENHLPTLHFAGEFFTKIRPDIDKAINTLSQGLVKHHKDKKLLRNIAQAYLSAGLTEKAIAHFKKSVQGKNIGVTARLALGDFLKKAGRFEEAAKEYESAFKENRDSARAVAKLLTLYDALKDNDKIQAQLARLKSLDKRIMQEYTKRKEKALAEAKEKKAKQKKKMANPRANLSLTFPAVMSLVEPVAPSMKRVGLINGNAMESTLLSTLLDFVIRPVHLNTEPLHKDFVSVLKASSEVIDNDAISAHLMTDKGLDISPAALKRVIKENELDAVLVYFANADATGDAIIVISKSLTKESLKVESRHADISFNADKLTNVNLVIGVIPLLLLLLIAWRVIKSKQEGVGRLETKILYNQEFEQGYFAVRLSKRPVKQSFRVEKLMTMNWTGEREDTEKKVRKFFKANSKYIAIAINQQSTHRNIPPGHYHVYITGLMLNIETKRPIGTYEVEREIDIERNDVAHLEVDLSSSQALVEFRILEREVTKQTRVVEEDGEKKEKEVELVNWVPVDGAKIEINNNPDWKMTSNKTEAASLYLDNGDYKAIATYQNHAAAHEFTIDSTKPMLIEMKLKNKNEVDLTMPEFTSKEIELTADDNFDIEDDNPLNLSSTNLEDSPFQDVAQVRQEAQLSAETAAEDSFDDDDFGLPDLDEEIDDSLLEKRKSKKQSTEVADASASPLELDELFEASEETGSIDTLFHLDDSEQSEKMSDEALQKARAFQKEGRYEDAAELFLRGGEYDEAASMGQKSGNQTLTYKIYGISYMKSGKYREAAEMFKLAEEPLLEAEALDKLKLTKEANMKRGEYWETAGNTSRALNAYNNAGAHERVAEIQERLGNHLAAGQAYMNARRFKKAADSFLAIEETKLAAEALELGGQYLKAADLYREIGSNAKVFRMLEKAGRFCEAAEGYKKIGLFDEAVHACQQVEAGTDDFLKAALIMGKIFIEKKEYKLARSVFHNVVENAEIGMDNIEQFYEFGVLVQEQGMIHEAYALFERIQDVKFGYGDVEIRLQNLQSQIEEQKSQEGSQPPPTNVPNYPGYRSTTPDIEEASETPKEDGLQAPVSSRYVFEAELGRGAMGVVFRAQDTVLGRTVAYKTVSSAIKNNPAALKYFLSEAKSLAALNHGNIVTVYDVGQESNNYFITMEYVDGRSLQDFIIDKGRLSLKNCVVIAQKIIAGLDYAHTRNIVHRDIKPSNIMISNEGEVKIMDFGLAKIMTDAMQDKTMVRGTPLYMAPEQVEGIGVDNRSDLYAFGVTLFEMATGTLPFTKGDIAYHHVHTAPPVPTRYNPSIPEAMENIIMKCLAKDKEERYQTALEIKEQLSPLKAALAKLNA